MLHAAVLSTTAGPAHDTIFTQVHCTIARSNSKATGEAAKFGARRLFEERCHTTRASMYFHVLFTPSHSFHLSEPPLLTNLCFSPFG